MEDIKLSTTYEEIQSTCNYILDLLPPAVGFDTETTVSSNYKPVDMVGVSLIQIALPNNHVFLFQIQKCIHELLQAPLALEKLLTSRKIIKVGVDITGDAYKIRSMGINMCGYIDIQDIATTKGESGVSMDDLCSKYIPEYQPKNKVLGDYDHDLTIEKIDYAARDARLSLSLYYSILNMNPPAVLTNDSYVGTDVHFDNWVSKTLTTSIADRSYMSIVNQAVNSYGPWRNRYTEKERRSKITKALDSYIERNIWNYDKLTERFAVSSLTEDNLGEKFHGTKISSVVNLLANSGILGERNPQKIEQLINNLHTVGKLALRNGKIYKC